MRFIYWTFVAVGMSSTPPQRLRELFETVKDFAKDNGKTVSAENTNAITASAVRFANNEGRELDTFLQVLRTVCKNDISKCDLDKLAWDSLSRLFEEGSSASVKSEAEPLSKKLSVKPVDPIAPAVQPAPISDSIEYLPIKSQKRSGESDSDSTRPVRSRSESREKVISILERQKDLRVISSRDNMNSGAQFLNYIHYRMVLHGEYDQLLYHLELLGGAHETFPLHVFYVFEDAYKKLTDESFSISESFETRMEDQYQKELKYHKFPVRKDFVISKLHHICVVRAAEYREPFATMLEMETRLLDMAKRGDLQALRYAINIYEYAGWSYVKKRTLFQRVFDYLR